MIRHVEAILKELHAAYKLALARRDYEKLQEQHNATLATLQQCIDEAGKSARLFREIRDIVHMPANVMSNADRIQDLRKLMP